MFDDGMFFISGPPPILPRPTPYSAPQAYALIPIPNVNQSFNTASPSPAQQQVLLNLTQSGPMSACPSPIISEGMIITEANWICIPEFLQYMFIKKRKCSHICLHKSPQTKLLIPTYMWDYQFWAVEFFMTTVLFILTSKNLGANL